MLQKSGKQRAGNLPKSAATLRSTWPACRGWCQSGRMKKILIIEDDQIVANIYRNKFTVEGFHVEIASDGPTGLETLRTFQPDAVILDLMLPGMTGVDVMKKVRALPEYAKLPIIVFSNTYLTNMVQEAWKA